MVENNLENAMVDIITKVSTGVDEAVGFLSAEIPDVVSQLLLWKTCSYAFSLVLLLVLLVASVKKMNYVKDEYTKGMKGGDGNFYVEVWHNGNRSLSFEGGLMLVLLVTTITISSLVAAIDMFSLLKISLAPKVWLIEYAATLAK